MKYNGTLSFCTEYRYRISIVNTALNFTRYWIRKEISGFAHHYCVPSVQSRDGHFMHAALALSIKYPSLLLFGSFDCERSPLRLKKVGLKEEDLASDRGTKGKCQTYKKNKDFFYFE